MDINVSLSGNVGTAVDYTAGNGYSFASFRLATTPRVRRNGEWSDGETTWITVEAANRTAENARASIRKGDPVLVVGRLNTKRWQGRDGEPRERLVLTALALGHDLSRGTSQFTRSERQSSGPGTEPSAGSWPNGAQMGGAEMTSAEVIGAGIAGGETSGGDMTGSRASGGEMNGDPGGGQYPADPQDSGQTVTDAA